jgi:hypothetical protein
MTERFKKGDTRSDGYRFKQYKKKLDGSLYEEWLSPESFQNAKNWHKTKKAKESQKRWNDKNIEKIREYSRNYQSRNREESKERSKRYARNNPEKRRFYESKRRSKINNSCFSLSKEDKKIILSIYESATRIANCLGILYHVDHIIPLSKGGTHTPSNVQVLPASINLKKKDKVDFVYE